MAERGGRIHLQTIPNGTVLAIRHVVNKTVDPDTSKFVTDGNVVYNYILPRDRHEAGNHKEELKYKNWTTTQTVENAFSLFKRGIIGQYHQLSPWHLTRYMREFCFRYNRRGVQPWIFGMTLNNMLCRDPLPYKKLVKF
jgi:hypothetical protein